MSAASDHPPREEDEVVVHLHAGQLFTSPSPCTIATVLGSCVAVCLFDIARLAGGANHFLLPMHAAGGRATARFGNVAIDELVSRMLRDGSMKRDLTAKLFGGACTMPGPRSSEPLGAQNVAVARRALAAHGIPITAEDVLGDRGRKLLFRTGEGHAWVRKL